MVYRPKHHLTAPQGRISEPSGMCLIGDELHVYFQHDPTFPQEPKRAGWGHAAAGSDGVWHHFPMALHAGADFDERGCLPGSVVAETDDGARVRILYTGEAGGAGEAGTDTGTQRQVAAEATDIAGPMGGQYRKRGCVIDAAPEGIAEDFRHPHVSRGPDGTWRMVVGARRANNTGTVILYTSPDLDSWELAGEIEFAGLNYNTASAHMWERPNLVRMSDMVTGEILDVLVFCPQFIDSDECGYVVGRLDGVRFEVVRDFTPLDFGHEFYAPQLIPYGGGALMLGWMGSPGRDTAAPLEAEGWVHSLTMVRELSLIDAHLHTSLYIPAEHDMVVADVDLGSGEFVADLVDENGHVGATVHWQPDGSGRGTVSLEADGLVRWAECGEGPLVFVADGTAVELTAGGGEVAFSSAVFAPGGAAWANFELRG